MLIRTALLGLLVATSTVGADEILEQHDGAWFRIENERAWRVRPDVVTVRLADPRRDAVAFARRLDGPLAGTRVLRVNRTGFVDLRLPPNTDVAAACARLRTNPLVAKVETATEGVWAGGFDPLFGSQDALENIGQNGGVPGADIHMLEGWALETGDPSIVIAVLDSGTQIDHEDLADAIWMNASEIPDNGVDDDSNGFIDDADGWDFGNGNNDPTSDVSHGTRVAGVVGAVRQNGIGIAGITGGTSTTPGCRIMALAVGESSPVSDAIDDAIVYATDQGARVITMSLTIGSSAAIDAAIEYAHAAGVFIDCATGNQGGTMAYPARHPLVVAVGASDNTDTPAGFNNFGPEMEVVAPGVGIVTTTIGGYSFSSTGTSFAAPHVAGLAGLILSRNPCLTNEDVRSILRTTADDVGAPGFDVFSGDGRINAGAALTAASASSACDCPADLGLDGSVGFADLQTLLQAWGTCPTGAACPADLDANGSVGFADLQMLLQSWGDCAAG